MNRWIIYATATGLSFAVGCGGGEGNVPNSAALIVEAQQAIEAGDTAMALESLDASIESEPTAWAYALRARIHATSGDDQAATTDCDAGLALDETNEELAWIRKELKKPKDKRFQQTEVVSSRK